MADLSVWGHSCVRLERGGARLVIDPGAWSDLSVLDTASAVLVTHAHQDHLDVRGVSDALARRPDLDLWGPAAALEVLLADGPWNHRLHQVTDGDHLSVVGFDVEVLGEFHATVHPDLPIAKNVAYLVDRAVLHPGDSFTLPPVRVDVLLAPVAGPWLKLAETIDYVRAVAPRVVVPIHDATASAAGHVQADALVARLGGDTEYRRLQAGDVLMVNGTRARGAVHRAQV